MGKDLKGKELGKGIIQKKTGRYEARYVDRFGKRVSIYGDSLSAVRKQLNEAIYENEKKMNTRDNITLNRWYEEWMDVYKFDTVRESTRLHYKNVYIKHIAPVLGNLKLDDITQLHIKRHLNNLKKQGFSYETRNKVRILLIDMFEKAIMNEYARKNPAKGITINRDEERDIRVLSEEEQVTFFDCSKGTFYDNLFVTAVSTGMRIGELAALRWSDIDLESRVIHVTRTLVYQKYESDTKKTFHFEDPKTKTSRRDIPINRQCELALKRQYMQKNIISQKAPVSRRTEAEFLDLLFVTKYNTPLNSQIVCDAIKKIVDDINEMRDYLDEMECFSAHCFRHTFATRCFEAGIQPKTVQSYLGHATLQMTMDLYTSVMPQYSLSEMDKFSNVLDKLCDSADDITEEKYAQSQKPKKIVSFCGDAMAL